MKKLLIILTVLLIVILTFLYIVAQSNSKVSPNLDENLSNTETLTAKEDIIILNDNNSIKNLEDGSNISHLNIAKILLKSKKLTNDGIKLVFAYKLNGSDRELEITSGIPFTFNSIKDVELSEVFNQLEIGNYYKTSLIIVQNFSGDRDFFIEKVCYQNDETCIKSVSKIAGLDSADASIMLNRLKNENYTNFDGRFSIVNTLDEITL